MRKTGDDTAVGWHKIAIYGGWIGTFVFAAWIVAPRMILGTDEPIALVITFLLPVLLIVIGCVTLGVPARRGKNPSKRSVTWLWIAFLGAFIVGLFLPDNTIFSVPAPGQTTALVSVLFGAGWEGAGSAIANPAAIIMLVTGTIGAVFAVLDSRAGGPIRTEDEDHLQGHGYFGILGDEEYLQR